MTIDERERRTILNYDKEALKRNIEKLRREIGIFQKEIEKHYGEIANLQRYVEMIEENEAVKKALKEEK